MSESEPIVLTSSVSVGSASLSAEESELLNGAAAAAIHFLNRSAVKDGTTDGAYTATSQAIEQALTAECKVILEKQIHKPVRSFEIKYLYRHDDEISSEDSELSGADREVCYVQIDAVVVRDWRQSWPLYPFAAAFVTFCFYLVYETVVMPFTPADFDVTEAAYRWWIIRINCILGLLLKGLAQLYDSGSQSTSSDGSGSIIRAARWVGQKASALCHWIEDLSGVRYLTFNIPVGGFHPTEEISSSGTASRAKGA